MGIRGVEGVDFLLPVGESGVAVGVAAVGARDEAGLACRATGGEVTLVGVRMTPTFAEVVFEV